MKIQRKSYSIECRVSFARPAMALVNQSGRLLEGILDALGTDFLAASKDVRVRSGAAVDDWSMQIGLFNGLGKISVTADAMSCAFNGLATDNDSLVVSDVVQRVAGALAQSAPTVKVVSETFLGNILSQVVEGNRESYFASVSFPGRSNFHQDISFKFRMRDTTQRILGLFELGPIWADRDQVLITYDVDTSNIHDLEFPKRFALVTSLIADAIASTGLELSRPTV